MAKYLGLLALTTIAGSCAISNFNDKDVWAAWFLLVWAVLALMLYYEVHGGPIYS